MVQAIRIKLQDLGQGDKRALYPVPVVLWGPNGVGVRPDTHPNALGKRLGNYLYIHIHPQTSCLCWQIDSNATKIGAIHSNLIMSGIDQCDQIGVTLQGIIGE